jgi:hypothetical protein
MSAVYLPELSFLFSSLHAPEIPSVPCNRIELGS